MRITIIILFVLFAIPVHAQQDTIVKAASLQAAFAKGTLHGRFRSVYITTINDGPLSDYYATAAGGVIKFETAAFHHFSVGLGGSFTYNLSSSDLGKPDSATGVRNRYELLLMDIEDPYNTNRMFRLDMLYLKYRLKNSQVVWGKQYIVTPFINPQDLFMRGSAVDGLYGSIYCSKKLQIEAAYIYGISANATTRWFHIGESIGVFPKGVNQDGSTSAYNSNTNSDGLGFIGIKYSLLKNLKLQLWNQYVDQVFNTGLFQVDQTFLKRGNKHFLAAIQIIRQDPLASGGNTDRKKTYFSPANQSWVLGGRVAYQTPALDISINYTRITADGRYQMPREWGREPMFTFLMREQIEGAGDVHAFTTRASYTFKKARIKADAGLGYYNMPDVTDARLSKYGMPSFIQYCAQVKYSFNKKLKGLEAELIYMYKQKATDAVVPDKYIINKVNMTQIAASLNFVF
ncbi:MAG: hypothetical protein JST82_05080 [Bacteroidetes bacterium]|nr:hypothetical protein [Bacteroidota bacterium]